MLFFIWIYVFFVILLLLYRYRLIIGLKIFERYNLELFELILMLLVVNLDV